MPRAGLDVDAVVRAAAALADAEGLGALTLARLAAELGVRAPSLYAHIDGVGDLRRRIADRSLSELTVALQRAATGRSGGEALAAGATAYRDYALTNRGSYAALQRGGNGSPDASARLLETVVAMLRAYGLDGDEALHAARIVRSSLHGFVVLESEGGFGLGLDRNETFARLVAFLDRGLRSQR
jgi:AcrR family transcriptional regulator